MAGQASFIAEAISIANQAGSSQNNSHSGGDTVNPYDRNIRVRRPLLEVPTFSGDFREYNTFWSKQFDRSSGIADILINEIEHLPRAQENSRSCRDTLNAISSRIVHLEQTGMPMNADRVWRRLILSKFTENICSQVIKKENEGGTGFEVKNILDAVDEIITLQENYRANNKDVVSNNARGHDNGRHQSKQSPSHRMRHACLCGEAHSPHQCARFPTPEARRMEAKRQRNVLEMFR
ncbi:hypothetical protein OSTOST_05696 [Ostertagia ostertagi]